MNRRPPRDNTRQNKINLLVIDGNSLFKRSILGAKDVFNRDGIHIGGIYQFITVLRKLIDENLYHHVLRILII